MARERPIASDVLQSPARPDASPSVGVPGADGLTYAQAHALRRCARLSKADVQAQKDLLAQRHSAVAGDIPDDALPARHA